MWRLHVGLEVILINLWLKTVFYKVFDFLSYKQHICNNSCVKGRKLCKFKCWKVWIVRESLPCVAA